MEERTVASGRTASRISRLTRLVFASRRTAPQAVALVATALAFFLRLHNLDYQSFWRDEMDAVAFASRSLPELAQMYLRVGENGPLYFTLLHFWLPLAGTTDFAVRFSSVLAGVGAVPVIYALASKLFGRWVGACAAIMLAWNPYHLWYSQETKMYALVALVACLSVLLLLHALDSSRWRAWAVWCLLLGAGFYLHFFMALLIVTEALVVIVAWRLRYRGAGRGVAILGALSVFYVPLGAWQVPRLLDGIPTSYTPYPIDMMISILLTKFTVGLQEPLLFGTALFTFLFAAGLMLPLAGSSPASRTISLAWTVVPLVLYVIVSLRVEVFLDRYLIFILPAFLLLVARGLAATFRNSLLVGTVAALCVGVLWLPGSWSQPLLKQDFKRSAAYVADRVAVQDRLIFLPSWERQYFDYYARPGYAWLDAPAVDEFGVEVAAAHVASVLADASASLWLFSVEPNYGDSRRQLQNWLDEHAYLLEDVQFANLQVRRYGGPQR